MKRIAFYILMVLTAAYLSGCDKIEGNHLEATAATDTNYTFPADSTPNVYRVLMEDYTGHTCGNCPTATRLLYNTIKPIYGDTLVTLGVHANYFAETCPPHLLPPGAPAGSYMEDFNTPAGKDWYTSFLLYSNPLGMVNRIDYPGNVIKTSGSWNGSIAGIIHNVPKVKIRIHNVYDPITDTLRTYSETKFLTQLTGTYKLNVVLSEDSIVSWQEDYASPDTNISNYVQRHVLRGPLNGSWGDALVTTSTVPAGTKFFRGYKQLIPAAWDAKHVNVVVFLYDDATKEILNVAEETIE